MWLDGMWADLFLLAGGAIVGGRARRHRRASGARSGPARASARALEAVAMLFMLHPAYVLALSIAAAVRADVRAVKLPFFFEVHSYAPPLEGPWDFFRSMLVPWLCVGAPLGAAILRLTCALTIDAMGEQWVRTARAKGVPAPAGGPQARRTVGAYATVASLFGASAPILVTNIVLVEVSLLRARVLPSPAPRPRPERGRRRQGHRHPDDPGDLDLGRGADRRAEPDRRPRDRAHRPADPRRAAAPL